VAAKSDRKKGKPALLKRLLPFFAPYRGQAFAAGLALTSAAFFTLLMPIALRRVIDLGFDQEKAEYIDKYFLAMIGVAGALAISTSLRYYFVTRLGERIVTDIRRKTYDHAIGMSPRFFETIRSGETLSRINTDTTLVQTLVASTVSIGLRNVLLLLGGIFMLLMTSAKLTGLVLLIVPVIVIPIILMGRRVRGFSKLAQDKIAETSAIAGETLGSVRDVQSFTQEDGSRARFGLAAEGAYDASHKRIAARSRLTAIVIFLLFTGIVSVMWIGASDVIENRMTAGELGQFILYAVIVAGAFAALSEMWTQLQQAAGATERLVEILDSEAEIVAPANPLALPEPRGEISFRDVSFSFPSRPDERALDRVTLHVKPGETVAVVGPSGAGKTTIFSLLQRFYDPSEGTIRLDGVALPEADPKAIRARLSVVPQEPAIFAASVLENILFGRPDATEEEARLAAEAAAASGFIEALPDGYATEVGERGVMLSGGQKQRIAIARAILRDAPVLLLDEATSALDAESERAVQQAFERLAQDRTTLVIAHRLATVKKADRIVVLEGGKIVAEGTHDSLVSEGGLYARLARLQFTGLRTVDGELTNDTVENTPMVETGEA
jgi:ATP-binding cassette subfamily B protein